MREAKAVGINPHTRRTRTIFASKKSQTRLIRRLAYQYQSDVFTEQIFEITKSFDHDWIWTLSHRLICQTRTLGTGVLYHLVQTVRCNVWHPTGLWSWWTFGRFASLGMFLTRTIVNAPLRISDDGTINYMGRKKAETAETHILTAESQVPNPAW